MYNENGRIDITAQNADSDSKVASSISGYFSTNGSYTDDYRGATSIPYVTGSNEGLSDSAASNADSDTTASKCNTYINAYGGTHSYVNRRATSIPYLADDDYAAHPQSFITATNTDSDVTITGKSNRYGYSWDSGDSPYRRATSIPYPSSGYNGRPDATANNADVDTNTGSTQYRWETAYNASGAYQYRRATALTYLRDNTDSRTVAGRCHEKNSRYLLRELFSII